jgi:hypothetical protein
MRTSAVLVAALLAGLALSACDPFAPHAGRPFREDRTYVHPQAAAVGQVCNEVPAGSPAADCGETLQFHADGTVERHASDFAEHGRYTVRGGRMEVTIDGAEGEAAPRRFDLSPDGTELVEPTTGRVWTRYQRLESRSTGTRALG